MSTKIWNINDIITANKVARKHFFSKDTMRFFSSRVLEPVYQGAGGVFFVTSEQRKNFGGDGPRRYTVREFNPETCDVSSASEFNVLSKYRAEKLARELADGLKQEGVA
jgi:hypothetical protein